MKNINIISDFIQGKFAEITPREASFALLIAPRRRRACGSMANGMCSVPDRRQSAFGSRPGSPHQAHGLDRHIASIRPAGHPRPRSTVAVTSPSNTSLTAISASRYSTDRGDESQVIGVRAMNRHTLGSQAVGSFLVLSALRLPRFTSFAAEPLQDRIDAHDRGVGRRVVGETPRPTAPSSYVASPSIWPGRSPKRRTVGVPGGREPGQACPARRAAPRRPGLSAPAAGSSTSCTGGGVSSRVEGPSPDGR